MTLSVDINRNRIQGNTSERRARLENRTVEKERRLVATIGMIAPLATFLAAAAWYLAI